MTNNLFKLLLIILCGISVSSNGQKMISDGSIVYSVSVEKGKDQPGIAEAFEGATLTVQFKGMQVRSDLNSLLRKQTVFFNSKTNTAVILKESGAEKYMINLNSSQWQHYNKKFADASFTFSSETKIIQGFSCAKATAKLNDGSEVVVFYNPEIKPVASGYEYVFKDLPGLPMEYYLTTGSIVVKYSAASVQNAPVTASRFDLPTSGYKILEYRQ